MISRSSDFGGSPRTTHPGVRLALIVCAAVGVYACDAAAVTEPMGGTWGRVLPVVDVTPGVVTLCQVGIAAAYQVRVGVMGAARTAKPVTLGDGHARGEQLTAELQHELRACSATAWPSERVLYLIWKDPWMAVACDTYIARTLACVGWHVTIPAGGWSGAARYPVIPDINAAAQTVDRVLLSSEPFMFRPPHVAELQSQLGVPIDLIDGEMTSWYGSRAIPGLAYLRNFRAAHLAA